MLTDAGDTEPAPIPVAIETSRAPGRGVANGRPVYSIHFHFHFLDENGPRSTRS